VRVVKKKPLAGVEDASQGFSSEEVSGDLVAVEAGEDEEVRRLGDWEDEAVVVVVEIEIEVEVEERVLEELLESYEVIA
jgi:hypothetical protein